MEKPSLKRICVLDLGPHSCNLVISELKAMQLDLFALLLPMSYTFIYFISFAFTFFLGDCYSQCGPHTRNIRIICEDHIRNGKTQVPSQSKCFRNPEWILDAAS